MALTRFTYRASDGTLTSSLTTVTITVNAVNDAPTAADDAYTTAEDTALTENTPGVLDNDSDPDHDTLSAVLVSKPNHGTLTLNANGSFTYRPDANFNGSDSFIYRANDGSVASDSATVNLTVTASNDSPTVTVAAGGTCGKDDDHSGTINLKWTTWTAHSRPHTQRHFVQHDASADRQCGLRRQRRSPGP
jgi:VCBS repeat-containing protein